MASSSDLIFQNSLNSFCSIFSWTFSFYLFSIYYFLLLSIASFIWSLLLSCSSKSLMAFSSASSTCLFRISSSLFLMLLRVSACLSIIFYLVYCFSANFCSSLSFLSWSRASLFLAYSSILFSSSSSFRRSSAWVAISSKLVFLKFSACSIYLNLLSCSLYLSLSSSSSTYLLINSPSSNSSYIRLMHFILKACSWSLIIFWLAIFLSYSSRSFYLTLSSYSSIFIFSSSSHYFWTYLSISYFLFLSASYISLSYMVSHIIILLWKAFT